MNIDIKWFCPARLCLRVTFVTAYDFWLGEVPAKPPGRSFWVTEGIAFGNPLLQAGL